MKRRLLLASPLVIAVAVAVLVFAGHARIGSYVALAGFLFGGLLLRGDALRPEGRSAGQIDPRSLCK